MKVDNDTQLDQLANQTGERPIVCTRARIRCLETDKGVMMKLTFKKYNFLAPSGRPASMHTLCTQALAPEGVTDRILVPLGIATSGQVIYALP